MGHLLEVIVTCLGLIPIFHVPIYLLATSCTNPLEFTKEYPDNWFYIIIPLVISFVYFSLGHLLVTKDTENGLIKIIASLSLPTTATICGPLSIYIGTMTGNYSIVLYGEEYVPYLRVIGFCISLTGLLLLISTNYYFLSQGKGTLSPLIPTTKLVVDGPYKYVRNPMIAGVFYIIVGEALCFNMMRLMIFAIYFFILNTVFFIFKEEPDLKDRFGEEFVEYCKHVSRWMYRFTPYIPEKKQA